MARRATAIRRRVLADLNRGWLSLEKARAVFGVAAKLGANGVDYELDTTATAKLRVAKPKPTSQSRKAKSSNRRRK